MWQVLEWVLWRILGWVLCVTTPISNHGLAARFQRRSLYNVVSIYIQLANLGADSTSLVGKADRLTVYGRAHSGRRQKLLRVAGGA